MKNINTYFIENNVSRKIFREPCHHLLSVGFEERCLAYPKFLSENQGITNHTFYCTYSPDENVSDYLKTLSERHKEKIENLLPAAVTFKSFSEIEEALAHETLSRFIFIDISSLPRMLTFNILKKIILNRDNTKNIHFIYTFPKEYDYEELQLPRLKIDLVFEDPRPMKNRKSILLIIPGFDRAYVEGASAFLTYNSEPPLKHSWLIPFPGRKYSFFERVIEAHLVDLKDKKYSLLPQEDVILSYEKLKKVIQAESAGDRDIFILPVGSRINCLAVLLSTLKARKADAKVNIMVPRTKWYNSSRSSGFEEPLIELIPNNIIANIK